MFNNNYSSRHAFPSRRILSYFISVHKYTHLKYLGYRIFARSYSYSGRSLRSTICCLICQHGCTRITSPQSPQTDPTYTMSEARSRYHSLSYINNKHHYHYVSKTGDTDHIGRYSLEVPHEDSLPLTDKYISLSNRLRPREANQLSVG